MPLTCHSCWINLGMVYCGTYVFSVLPLLCYGEITFQLLLEELQSSHPLWWAKDRGAPASNSRKVLTQILFFPLKVPEGTACPCSSPDCSSISFTQPYQDFHLLILKQPLVMSPSSQLEPYQKNCLHGGVGVVLRAVPCGDAWPKAGSRSLLVAAVLTVC